MPAAPVSVPPDALNVPEPRLSRLMPLPALFVELTVSKASVGPLVPLTSTAGPPVALTFAVPPLGTVTLPALLSRKAAALPDVVVSARSSEGRRAGGAGERHAAGARGRDGDVVDHAAGAEARARRPRARARPSW